MDEKTWMSKGLFEKALQKFTNCNNIKVLDYTVKKTATGGESFCSQLYRTIISYESDQNGSHENMSVLIKRSPEMKQSLRFTEELKYFQKEVQMYEKTLPEFNNILGDMGPLSARCLYTQLEPFPLLMVEDISPMGFKVLDRIKGLDLEHCLYVVEKLFHVASLVMYDKTPDSYKNYSESMFWGRPIVREWVQLSTEALIKACRESLSLKNYAIKLDRIKNQIVERCSAAVSLKINGFNVLNHGDPWTTNFLFLYGEDGKIIDMRMVDYQVVVYGSPAIDLHYFWATSPTIDVRRKDFDTVLQHYYEHLILSLRKLQFTPINLPTKEEIINDWVSKAYYGLISATIVMPLIKCDNRQDANWDGVLATDNKFEGSFRHHIYCNPTAWEHLEYILPFFDRLGVFDY